MSRSQFNLEPKFMVAHFAHTKLWVYIYVYSTKKIGHKCSQMMENHLDFVQMWAKAFSQCKKQNAAKYLESLSCESY